MTLSWIHASLCAPSLLPAFSRSLFIISFFPMSLEPENIQKELNRQRMNEHLHRQLLVRRSCSTPSNCRADAMKRNCEKAIDKGKNREGTLHNAWHDTSRSEDYLQEDSEKMNNESRTTVAYRSRFGCLRDKRRRVKELSTRHG